MKDQLAIRKYILDAELQTNLQIASVSIIVAFTYFIGAAIAIISHQINWENSFDRQFLLLTSVFIWGISFSFFIPAVNKIIRIIRAIYKTIEEV